jgi:hypothetical protein
MLMADSFLESVVNKNVQSASADVNDRRHDLNITK